MKHLLLYDHLLEKAMLQLLHYVHPKCQLIRKSEGSKLLLNYQHDRFLKSCILELLTILSKLDNKHHLHDLRIPLLP